MVFQNVGWGRLLTLLGALLLGAAPSARAVDVVVTSQLDDGSGGTLREAGKIRSLIAWRRFGGKCRQSSPAETVSES